MARAGVVDVNRATVLQAGAQHFDLLGMEHVMAFGDQPIELAGTDLDTPLLLSSSVTVTWAHWGLKKDRRAQLCTGLAATIALGIAFLYCQGMEYTEAYQHLGLTPGSGIYGSTFFMLTGFHGLHVTIGTIMLIVILLRALKGHFRPDDCFGFEGVSWYWHFVDVVWLNLFVFVYII